MSFSVEDGWPEDDRNQQSYYVQRSLLRKFCAGCVRVLGPLAMKVNIEGAEQIPQTGRLILASNHLTNFDVIVFELALPRHVVWMAKESLYTNRYQGAFLRGLGSFEVRRGQHDLWAMRFARHVIESGEMLGIFTEGSRSKNQQLKPGKLGAARLAIEHNCPITPLAITGTHRILKSWKRRAQLHFRFGAPIYPRPDESAEALTERVMYTIASMLPPENRGAYADPPAEYAHLFSDRELVH